MIDRKSFIGGSDIASVMGLSRWKSPLQLWAEKTGKVEPDDLSNVEAVEMGLELEETVARLFTKRTGMKVRRAPKNYQHDAHPYFRCQVDRLITKTGINDNDLLECKTASAWKEKEWQDEEIPQEYILQVMWQLGITHRMVGHIAVLIGGQKFRYKKINFDPDLFEKMLEEATYFWKMVQDDTPPMAVGMDNYFIADIHPDSDEKIQEVEELNDRIGLLQQLKNTIKETIDQKNEVEAGIKQVIGDNLGIKTSEYQVTWKSQVTNRVDVALLKAAKVYEQYILPSKSRVLRVKKAKAEGK